jgi:murein L,D-transpeptidase YafK
MPRARWPIGLATDPITGSPPVGHKQREGDLKTPEGWYTTSDKTWSSYYHAIYIHYPNEADTKAALKDERLTVVQAQAILAALAAGKVPSQNTPLGGELLIHGGGSETDWTLGCVAMNNKDIDALRANLPLQVKTDILLLP